MIKRIGFLLIGVSVMWILNNKKKEKKEDIIEKNNINMFFEKEEVDNTKIYTSPNEYLMILEIPKINLKKGLYSIESLKNNVNQNLEIINSSNMPDIENGNLVIAGHSGTSDVSYFRYLYKLVINDYCYIYYNGKKYTYKIVNIYNEEKNGKITIHKDNGIRTITLITCTLNNDKMQTVYIGNPVNIESY